MAGTAVLPTYVTCITSPPPHIQRRLSLSSPHRVSLPSHLRPSQLCSLTLSSQPRRVNMAAVSARGNITGSAVGGVKRNSFFCHTSMDSALSVFYPSPRHNITTTSAIAKPDSGGGRRDYFLRHISSDLAVMIEKELAEVGEGGMTEYILVSDKDTVSATVSALRDDFIHVMTDRVILFGTIGFFLAFMWVYDNTNLMRAKSNNEDVTSEQPEQPDYNSKSNDGGTKDI